MKLRTLIIAAILLPGMLCPTAICADQGTSTSQTASEEDAKAEQKLPSKDDVNAIGTRDIGGRGVTNWYSLDYELRLGTQWARVMESRLKLVRDPLISEYVNRVAQTIVRNSDAQVPFKVKVIDDSGGLNTFALPGGFLYVSSGLILTADNEAEMAGVLAHEIAHVTAHHAVRQITRENLSQLATMPIALVAGPFGQILRTGAAVAVPMSMSKFSRSFETEADYLGLQYMYKAGYDPGAFVAFLERAAGLSRERGVLKRGFSMYPKQKDRIRQSQLEIEKILPSKEEYIVSTSDFDEVKEHLRKNVRGPRLNDKSHVGPVLRQPESPSDNFSLRPDSVLEARTRFTVGDNR